MYVCEVRSGGGVRVGVGGGGADPGGCEREVRLRGTSLGSFALRSGGGEGTGCDVSGILRCVVL